MLYKELDNYQIKIPAKSNLDIDAGDGCVLVPTNADRIFLNWLNDKDKIIATHTLKYSTLVTKKVRLINPDTKEAVVLQVKLPSQNG
jgi:hypothetical protein